MSQRADSVLKYALALAALMAGGGVGFYYGIYLPSQDIRRQSEDMARRHVEAKANSDALAERARREQAAQTAYEDCTSTADLAYKNHWTAVCRAQNAADVAEYEDCADDLFSTDEGCREKHPIRPERDCALSPQAADRLVEERNTARQQCLGTLRAAQDTASF